MHLAVHNQILWHACLEAERRLGNDRIGSPAACYPYLVCGSWMNDMNQSTLFTDWLTEPQNADGIYSPEAEIRRFFKFLWIKELKGLLSIMEAGPQEASRAAAAFRTAFPNATNKDTDDTSGFGSYRRFDHLDVVYDKEDSAQKEYGASVSEHASSKTIQTAMSNWMDIRLLDSSFNKESSERLEKNRIIILGRALHTAADFYAHSNYIELLLWSMVFYRRNRFDENVIDAFNRDVSSDSRLLCPLPVNGSEIERLTRRGTILWYGPEPKFTPLASCIFNPVDTAFSLLKMYSAHLEIIQGKSFDNEALNLAMAVFNIPNREYLEQFFSLYKRFSDILNDIGNSARIFLADALRSFGSGLSDSTMKGIFDLCAALVQKYDRKEANEWARAGQLKYTAYILARNLANEFNDQKTGIPLLPHHSLLCKDSVPTEKTELLRFHLACLFAVEATSDLLVMHFSSATPTSNKYQAICEKRFVHPSSQLGNMKEDVLLAWLDGSFTGNWSSLCKSGQPVMA